jgi:hypothetical protein
MEAMSSGYVSVYVCVQQYYSGNCVLLIPYIEIAHESAIILATSVDQEGL